MMEFILVPLIVVGLLGLVASPILVGAWILRPLDRLAREKPRAVRFTMLDILGLALIVQLPLALIHWITLPEEVELTWIFYSFGLIASALIWWVGVLTLSKAGVNRTHERAVLVFGVLPMAYFASFAVVVLPLVIAFHESLDLVQRGALAGVELALIAGLYLSGRYTRYVARTAANSEEISCAGKLPSALPETDVNR